MMAPKVYIEMCDLTVQHGDLRILDIQDLRASGNIFGLIGHNGSGKSTLIKTVLALLEPQRGNIQIRDGDGTLLLPHRDMAFCPETGAVFADILIEQYLVLWCRIKYNDGSFYRRNGAHYVERLGIGPLLRKKGRELSKGQRRRVQTAIGFMSDPKLFLFDEPFDGLDVQRTNELMQIISDERNHRSFLISSHRMDVMERLADQLIVLQEGRLRTNGSLAQVCSDLVNHHAAEQVPSLIDAMRSYI